MFSFHESVGVISEDLGFVEANVIEAERIGQDVGGGICQVSTTVFRAALLAGMPIYEWWPHDYRLEFYERDGWGPGFDASILQPPEDPFSGGDFKFENPTDGWLLVESWADGARVIVNIYGPETGWKVDVSDEQAGDPIPPTPDLEVVDEELDSGCVVHTELPVEGLVVWFTRVVYDADGNVLREGTFESPYKSRGNVWKVAPDMVGSTPAKGGTNWGNCSLK
jgi:vancomycin resistance protein YoaR